MISPRLLGVVPAAWLIVAVAGCGGGGDCGDLASGVTAPCPLPEYGHARVEGTVLYADASPAVLVQVSVICRPPGLNSNYTDQQGRYSVSLVYVSGDTINDPLPPRAPDGSFELACEVSSEVRPQVVARESVAVRFSPPELEVTPTVVELREPGP